MSVDSDAPGAALGVAVLTVSDTRGPDNDTSGDYLAGAAAEGGHEILTGNLTSLLLLNQLPRD